MKKLYYYYCDCGRMGEFDSLFVADEQKVQDSIGKCIYFGEALGKHSDIICTLSEEDLEVKSDDQDFINKLIKIFDREDIAGYNPLNFIRN